MKEEKLNTDMKEMHELENAGKHFGSVEDCKKWLNARDM